MVIDTHEGISPTRRSSKYFLDAMSRTARILIVNRNTPEREALTRRLDNQGYICECCNDAAATLKLLAVKNFDLILADASTSAAETSLFLKEILSISPDAAIILTTLVDDIGAAIESLKEGAYDWISRPFSNEEITLSVSRALEKRKLLLENRGYQRTLEEQVASRTSQLHEALKVLEFTYHSTLVALSRALDSRDRNSAGRSPRVMAYARRLGRKLGFSNEEVREVEYGAALHDIGKIGVPDALLRKRECDLTEEDRTVLRTHPEIGCRILSGIKFLSGAARLVLQTHECYDGKGYPRGIRGEEISPGARVLAVVHTFERLSANASTAAEIDEALHALECLAGNQLDPHMTGEFLKIPAEEWLMIKNQALSKHQ